MNHLFVGLLTQALCQVPFKVALATLTAESKFTSRMPVRKEMDNQLC